MRGLRTCVAEPLEPRELFAAGALDPSFGQGGRLVVQFPGSEAISVVRDRAVQPDGKIVISGEALDPAGGAAGTDFALARLNPDGTPDTTFGGGDGVVVFHDEGNADVATGVALQADGKIVASGMFSNNDAEGTTEYALFGVLRFNPDGTPDATWGTNGVVATLLGDDPQATPLDTASDVLVDSAGRILVIGARSDATTGGSEMALVRYDAADGSLDPTFGTGGKVFARVNRDSEAALSGVFQPDGKLVVTGIAFDIPDAEAARFATTFVTARFNADGTLDPAFGAGGAAYSSFSGRSGGAVLLAAADAIAIQPDGKIVVGGLAARGGAAGVNSLRVALARLNPDGSPDLGFGKKGLVESSFGQLTSVNQILIEDDGRIVCSGLAAVTAADAQASRFSALLVQYTPQGKLDKTFGTGGRVIVAPLPAATASASASASASAELEAGGAGVPFKLNAVFSASRDAAGEGSRPSVMSRVMAPAAAAGTPDFNDVLQQQAAIVVSLGDTFLVVSSSNERVNAARLIGNGPDLAVAAPVGKPRRATAGGKGAAVVRVVNVGNGPVSGTTTLVLVLSADGTLDAGDRTAASAALGTDLGPRRRKAIRFRFDYPTDLPAGAYFFLAVATPGPDDVNASNNAAASAAPVSVGGAGI